jgi:hypothetical protein
MLPDDVLPLVARHTRAVCREWRAAYDQAHPRHLFATSQRVVLLPPCSSYVRHQQHAKATRLGFRHVGVGAGARRRVALGHPSGPVRLALVLASGRVAVHFGEPPPRKKKKWYLSREADEDGPYECIKCGCRTWCDWCPECGRPTM